MFFKLSTDDLAIFGCASLVHFLFNVATKLVSCNCCDGLISVLNLKNVFLTLLFSALLGNSPGTQFQSPVED